MRHAEDEEWLTYTVNVRRPDWYTVSGRYSKDGTGAGTVALDWGRGYGVPVFLENTTHEGAFAASGGPAVPHVQRAHRQDAAKRRGERRHLGIQLDRADRGCTTR